MSDMPELLAKARDLGAALAAHPHVTTYYAAQRAVGADAAAQKLLQDYHQHLNHIGQLEAERKPVEVADKHKVHELENQIAGQATLKSLMRAQADYVALMNQVNQAMEAPLADLGVPEKPA